MTLIDAELLPSLEAGGRAKKEAMAATLQAFDTQILGNQAAAAANAAAFLASAVASERTNVTLSADGVATVTTGVVALDGYQSANEDSLTGLSLDLADGRVVIVTPQSGKTITVVHGDVDDGGIDLDGGTNLVLSAVTQALIVQRVGVRWREIRPAGSGGGLSSVAYDVKDITGNYTLTAADAWLTAPGGTLTLTTLRVRHASSLSTAIAITQPDSLAEGLSFQIHQAPDQTGAVTIQRETLGTINEKTTAVPFAGPGATAWLQVIQQSPARSTLEGEIAEPTDLADQVITNHRAAKLSLSGTQTLDALTAPAGSVIVNTGAAATWSLPTRVATGEADEAVELTILNRGSGSITLSASGVTIKGATAVAADAMATVVWETNGATEYAWVATTS